MELDVWSAWCIKELHYRKFVYDMVKDMLAVAEVFEKVLAHNLVLKAHFWWRGSNKSLHLLFTFIIVFDPRHRCKDISLIKCVHLNCLFDPQPRLFSLVLQAVRPNHSSCTPQRSLPTVVPSPLFTLAQCWTGMWGKAGWFYLTDIIIFQSWFSYGFYKKLINEIAFYWHLSNYNVRYGTLIADQHQCIPLHIWNLE